MVQDLFLWSFKVSIVISLFYTAYWLLFRNNTHFQLRRVIIIASLILAVLMPFIKVEISVPWSNPVQQQLELITRSTENTPNPVIANTSSHTITPSEVESSFSWTKFLSNTYIIGLTITFCLFFLELIKLANWYYFGARRTDIQDNVITHNTIKYPFSFWKWIFIPQGTDYDQDIWEIIEKHETAHLNQYHTFDMVFANLIQCFLWYNPIVYIIQKELKENHEALADQSVLNTTDFKTYAQALLKVSINSNALTLGHSFALISTLSKRITTMQKQSTHMKKTITNSLLLVVFVFTLMVTSRLDGQEIVKNKDELSSSGAKTNLMPPLLWLSHDKLTERHRKSLTKLQKLYPNKTITSGYSIDIKSFEYTNDGRLVKTPLYFDRLDVNDKAEIFEKIKSDTTRVTGISIFKGKAKYTYGFERWIQQIKNTIDKEANYIVFYESSKEVENDIFDISEVDIKPEPIGGIETMVRAIALEIEIPENIDKKDLPASIDFEVVVNGGALLTNINLLTELKGSDKENKEMYLFFGQVHDMMLDKVRDLYNWKRGIKDGKEVRVRTTIAIPTKYM